jgi:hypothetical protein
MLDCERAVLAGYVCERQPFCLTCCFWHMRWRKCGAHKVCYEWAVSQPAASHIHNTGGRCYYVGL